MPAIRGVLLDVDGTLLASNEAHAAAWKKALHGEGVTASHEALVKLVGMGADQLLPQLGLSADEGPGERAAAQQPKIFMAEHLAALVPTPGARRLVARFRAEGLKVVVASSSSGEAIQRLLKAATIDDLVEDQATSSDAKKSKPHPDIVEAAIARAGLPKEALVMLGDTPYDVAAARRAGVLVVCVRCGGWADRDLHGAAAIYDSPEAIAEGYERSLFANR